MSGMMPELGQLCFGCPTGEYTCPSWVDALVRDILREIARVYWNVNQREWDQLTDPGIPGILFRPYYWGDDEAEAARPNLQHGNVEVRWYKHPMRSSSLNVDPQPDAIVTWYESVLKCIAALEKS